MYKWNQAPRVAEIFEEKLYRLMEYQKNSCKNTG
jgi:hypothetical protein